MAAAFAICPHCLKNITLESEVFDAYNCPLCEGSLTMELLRMKESMIDMEEANMSFETGKQYFDNTDFREAQIHFKKSLKFNANHYLSFYYAGICDIYENEKNPEYDRVLNMMRILKYSFLKLDSAQVDMQYKIPFVLAALREVNTLLVAEFQKIDAEFERQNASRTMRHLMMLLAKHVNSFLTLDKEFLLTFNEDVAIATLQFADLAILACIKSTQTRGISETIICVPQDEDFDSANKIFSSLLYFAQNLDPNYSIERHRPDFAKILEYTIEAEVQIDKYNAARGTKDRAVFISVKGQVLNYLKEQCKAAMLYTYNVLFKNLYVKKKCPQRLQMLNQGIHFCYELLYPRISITGLRKVSFSAPKYTFVQEIAPYLDAFLQELYVINKKAAINSIENFYREVFEMTRMYYDTVTKQLSNSMNHLKLFKSKDYFYYSEFLTSIVFTASLALIEQIEFMPGKSKNRMVILKLGKLAAEEFLLLHDYKIIELEKNPIYAEIIKIYNSMMDALDKKSPGYYG